MLTKHQAARFAIHQDICEEKGWTKPKHLKHARQILYRELGFGFAHRARRGIALGATRILEAEAAFTL